jgi:hypothetical protein
MTKLVLNPGCECSAGGELQGYLVQDSNGFSGRCKLRKTRDKHIQVYATVEDIIAETSLNLHPTRTVHRHDVTVSAPHVPSKVRSPPNLPPNFHAPPPAMIDPTSYLPR